MLKEAIHSIANLVLFCIALGGWYAILSAPIKSIFVFQYHQIDKDQKSKVIHQETQDLWKKWLKYANLQIFGWALLIGWTILWRSLSNYGTDLKWIIWFLPIALIPAQAFMGPERLWYWNPKLGYTMHQAEEHHSRWHYDNFIGWIKNIIGLAIGWLVVLYFFGHYAGKIAHYIDKLMG